MLPVASTIRDLRIALLPWREAGENVALVPTMGALHNGHRALILEARKIAKRVIVSIFVNPMQFGPNEDFQRYPRMPEEDRKFLAEAGCDLLFAPNGNDMYPEGFVTKIDPGPLGSVLEGAIRPGHFTGVATVVTKLLLQTIPDIALFGEKDYQQLLVIRRIARDLDIPVHIGAVPTVRDTDGLALSSRNAYLTPEQRKQAALFPQILSATTAQISAGKPIDDLLKTAREQLTNAGFKLDYLELRDARTFAPVHELVMPARLLSAIRIGPVRLIDNHPVMAAA
jgi:pantoate--beta-alanine ligase